MNLFQNAIQAMPDGGRLSIRFRMINAKSGSRWGIEVEDTGGGIAPEHIKQVFDPFFTTKEPGEGTGLGLAIAFSIVQDFGGTIRVDSRLNHGTTFVVELPAAKGE